MKRPKQEKMALSIEQMEELVTLGIDTSKASMCWYPDNDPDFPDYLLTYAEKGYEGRVPAFTLQNMLPGFIPGPEGKDWTYDLSISNGRGQVWEMGYVNRGNFFRDQSSLNCAFELLKWCTIYDRKTT